MKDVNEFYLFYEENILPKMDYHISERRNYIIVSAIITGILSFGAVYISIKYEALIPTLAVIAVVWIIVCLLVRRWNVDAGPLIISYIVQFIDPSISYRFHATVPGNSAKRPRIFEQIAGKFEMSEIIEGKVYGVPIRMEFVKVRQYLPNSYAELPLYITSALDKTPWRSGQRSFTLWEGTLVTLDFNKDFRYKTSVVSRASQGSISKIFDTLFFCGVYSGVELENSDFTEMFAVFSLNEQEARYLLTPVMMEGLMNIARRIDKDVNFTFLDSKLYIWTEESSFMGVNLFEDAGEFDKIAELYVHLGNTFDIVKELGLDTRIWTKE